LKKENTGGNKVKRNTTILKKGLSVMSMNKETLSPSFSHMILLDKMKDIKELRDKTVTESIRMIKVACIHIKATHHYQ